MQQMLRIARGISILALTSVLVLPSVLAATANISTNQSAYYLSSGESLSLSASIQAGADAGTLVDIYVVAQINSGTPLFFLGPNLIWGTATVPVVQRFPLADVSAPNFYNTGVVAGLPTGNYQFFVVVVRTGLDPTNTANWVAFAATTVAINPLPPPGTTVTFNPPATMKGTVGTFFQFDFSPFAAGGSSPYHFQKDTGGGFPPMGLILAPSGVLSGTPSYAGTSTTSVCAVDLGGNQKCADVAITIAPTVTGRWVGSWSWSGPGSFGCHFNDGGAMSVTLTQTGTTASGSDLTAAGVETRQESTCNLMSVDTASGDSFYLSATGDGFNLQFSLFGSVNGLSFSGTATLANSNNTLTGTFVRSTGGSGSFSLNRQ